MNLSPAPMIDDSDSSEDRAALPAGLSADDVRTVVEQRLAAVDVDAAVKTALDYAMDSLVARVAEALRPWVDAKVAEARDAINAKTDLKTRQAAAELIQGFGVAERKLAERLERRMGELLAARPAVPGPSGPGAKQGDDPAVVAIVGSPLFKEVLDKRFRSMLQHLENEVIPRAVKSTA